MKKRWMICLALALWLLALGALGEEIPEDLQQQIVSEGSSLEFVLDVINIQDAEGSDWCVIARKYDNVDGFKRLVSGDWGHYWSGGFWFSAEDTRLIREGEHSFRAESESLDAWMRYESRGEGFLLTAWRDGNAWKGTVEMRGNTAVFLPDGGGAAIQVPVGDELRVWLSSFDDLPKTPEEMRARAGIGREGAQALMPGWTMGYYEMFNSGTLADAAFYRVENGQLTVCSLTLDSQRGVTRKSESLAVPLSQKLLERLKTEDPEALLDVSGYGSTFLTEDAWDQEKIPIRGKEIYNDLQAHGLLALTERDGKRYIIIAEPDEKGVWQARESKPLSQRAWLDLFHTGDDELGLEWMRGERELQCGFVRRADGEWRMEWAWAEEGDYSLEWFGVQVEWDGMFNNVYAYGSADFSDLFQCDFDAFPQSGEEAAARLDTAGWAAVNNPNPEDRLHLRDEPSKNGTSLGKFYNGTPLRVLEEKGDWVRVRVGLGDTLEGWMMKQYLAFGDQLRRVTPSFPELTTREGIWNERPLRVDGKGSADFLINDYFSIVGIRQETGQWIVMMRDGRLCLTPLNWFWEGNG